MPPPPDRPGLHLRLLAGTFAVCRVPADAGLPGVTGDFVSVTRTPDELSIVCAEKHVPAGALAERGWRCLQVEGRLDLLLTGILAGLTAPLAGAGIPVFAVSTYDTDYLLVRGDALETAVATLERAGYRISGAH
jgi:hypothetical protein